MSITFKRRLKPRDFLNRENSIKRVLNHSTRFKYRNLSCQGHVTNCWLTRRTAPIMWCHHQKPTWLSKITKNRMGWMKARVRSRMNWKLYDRRYCDDHWNCTIPPRSKVYYSRYLTFTDDPLSRQTWLILYDSYCQNIS